MGSAEKWPTFWCLSRWITRIGASGPSVCLDTNRTKKHVSDQLLPSPRSNNLFCTVNRLCNRPERHKNFPPKTLRSPSTFTAVVSQEVLRQRIALKREK
jgi:hypothetical protein